jgi:ABC-type ATPase with predicted acetyltransferase domain
MIQIPHLAPPIRSRRAQQVAQWFGLRARTGAGAEPSSNELRAMLPPPGSVTLITGPSGAGKSSLLRALRGTTRGPRWIDFGRIETRDVPLVDCFDALGLNETLALLARVGLCEAWTYLRTPSELSDGQGWRLKLALALHQASRGGAGAPAHTILWADEFAAVLDRVTAMVVSRALRKSICAPLSALVATSHDDLAGALKPDLTITCDFANVQV